MEVWVAIRADANRGSGTQKDPYSGNTISLFDEVMSGIPPVSLIHLGKGLFRRSVGSWVMRAGWQIEGAGVDQTTVQFGGRPPQTPYATSVLGTDWNVVSGNVAVRQLLTDGNWAEIGPQSVSGANGEKNCKTGGVSIAGSNAIIDTVRSINTYGSLANSQEQFAFVVSGGGAPGAIGSGNVIRNCVAELPAGNYGSPYAIFGVQKALVKGCRAVGRNNGTSDAGWVTGGVNLANVFDSVIDGCTFIDCMSACYHDTSVIDGLQLLNTILIRGASGFMNNSPNADKNVVVKHNHFSVQNRQSGSWSLGIGNIGAGTLAGIDLEDNVILKDPTGHGQNNLIGISLRGGSGAKVLRNIVDAASVSNFVPAGTQCFGNSDQTGNVVPGLEDTASPAPGPGPAPAPASA